MTSYSPDQGVPIIRYHGFQAKEKLTKAIELMRGCGAEGWVNKYERELAIV